MSSDTINRAGQPNAAAPFEENFKRGAEAFMSQHARRKDRGRSAWGEGNDVIGLVPERTPDEERALVESARRWQALCFDHGFGWIDGPARYGGAELSQRHMQLWEEIEAEYETPSLAPLGVGLHMVAPTILEHGSDVVKDAYLRALYRGDLVACQLFSEPGAGSDLAGIRTRAVQDNDGSWIVNGQKVWTSRAHFSDIGEIICRTDPGAAKHKGLTAFVVDMRAPGVVVRPLRQMTGGAHFNEVFLTDVRIPDTHRLGDVNAGWQVALTTLMNERAGISAGKGTGTVDVWRLFELARHQGLLDRDDIRQKLATIYINDVVARQYNARATAQRLQGATPGPEMSIGKLNKTSNLRRISELVSELLGPLLAADTQEWGTYVWNELVLWTPGLCVAGGTDEIMRNILAERVLGLPKS